MYQVSDAYKLKMLDQVQTHRLTGTLDDSLDFTDADVIGVSYKNQCSGKNVSIGSVNIGVLKLTFLKEFLNRGEYYGKKITISDGLLLGYEDNTPVWEDIPICTFYIAEAVWTAAGMIDVTAYDCLSKLDKQLNLDQSSGLIYSWCSYIAAETGTTFGMTAEECAALPNGTELISPYEEINIETYRDLLSAVVQMIGGFAYADKDGSWRIKPFDNTSDIDIPKNRRMSGAKFSDFETYYDGVQYTDVQSKIVRYVGDNEGLSMNLGSQPFLQYGSADAIERRARRIVDVLEQMTYTPYDVSLLPAFIALDLGDVISFIDDYTEDTTSGAVMTMTWTYNKSVKVQCLGDNPNLRSGQSKTDKNISGLMKFTAENEVTYYNYANIEPITFGSEEEVSIARLRFTSAQKTTVKILHEFIFDMLADLSTDGSYEVHYYLDNELVAYSPYERVGGIYGGQSGTTELSICRDFFYILKDVEPNNAHIWEVKILAHGVNSVTIDTNHAHVTLEGQRMYGEEYFSGLIEASDELTIIPLGYLGLVSITDTVTITTPQAAVGTASDNVGLYDIASLEVIPISEGTGASAPQIRLRGGAYINTEDHKRLCTEDGIRFITSR